MLVPDQPITLEIPALPQHVPLVRRVVTCALANESHTVDVILASGDAIEAACADLVRQAVVGRASNVSHRTHSPQPTIVLSVRTRPRFVQLQGALRSEGGVSNRSFEVAVPVRARPVAATPPGARHARARR